MSITHDSTEQQYLSIIIPVLNEASNILTFLKPLQFYRKQGHEIILVDGGSYDTTIKLAQGLVDKSLSSKKGRSYQMNLGAQQAKNSVLVFLHSDTILPHCADTLILNSLTATNHWGRFNIRLSSNRKIFRVIEALINFRSKYTKVATGDQTIFITKKLFNKINGFPEIMLMEDIAISKKLRKNHPCICLVDKVITSSRRWEKHGIYKTIILMWSIRFLYYIGIKPNQLFKLYYEKK